MPVVVVDWKMESLTMWYRHLVVSWKALDISINALMMIGAAACICYVFFNGKAKGVPLQWPLVGMLPSLFFHINAIYDWQTRTLIRCGGTYIFKGPSNLWSAVFTSDPANVEYILKTRFSSFPKGRIFTNVFRDLLGYGIFNADGELWTQQRRAAVGEFNSSLSFDHMTKSLQETVCGRLIPILDGVCVEGSCIDLQDVFLRFTFDNVCSIAFGVEPGCLGPGLPSIPFAKAFEEATEATALRFVTPIFLRKTMRRLGFGIDVKLRAALKTIDEFAMEIVSSRREELNRSSAAENGGDGIHDRRADLLSNFMQSRDEDGVFYSDKFLRDICINFILAGRDTSSVGLSWFFWLLLRHPRVEEKIVEEIHQILQGRQGFAGRAQEQDGPVCFSREELKQMHYLHASLSEAMRLYPPVPIDRKQVTEHQVLPDGTAIKKGTVVYYVIYAMGRMESIWGKDCLEFKPERWLNEGIFANQSAYKYTVFNGGPRMCLGKDFAYLQMKHVAASILYRFRLKMIGESHRGKYKLGVTLVVKLVHPACAGRRRGGREKWEAEEATGVSKGNRAAREQGAQQADQRGATGDTTEQRGNEGVAARGAQRRLQRQRKTPKKRT
eukprot:Gb_41154 [translate_table: standard]